MGKRPAIGYVLTPVSFGGAERVSLNYLKHADRRSWDITPVLLTRPWEVEPFFARELTRYGISYLTIAVAVKPDEGYLRVLRSMRELFSACVRNRFDLLHTHGYFADIIAAPASWLLGIPHVATCHGFIETDSHLRLYCRLDRLALRGCRRIIAVSDGIGTDLINGGIRKGRIISIRNAVEKQTETDGNGESRESLRSVLGVAEDCLIVGYAGRLSEEKGIDYLIRAVASLKTAGRNGFRVLIVGDGPAGDKLRELSRRCEVEDITSFVGFRVDARRWIGAMDVFVLPSLTEGTPLALLEAMADGVACVATNVGEVPKIIRNGVNGICVEPRDVTGIATAVEELLRDEPRRAGMAAEAGKAIAGEYGIDQWRERIENQYRAVLSDRDLKNRP